MDIKHAFLLREVIDDLVNTEKSLVSPLMRLGVLSRLIKNEKLLTFTSREVEGYGILPETEIPDYRKTPGVIYLDLYSSGLTTTKEANASLLQEPEYKGHFRYFIFRQSVPTIEQMIKDRGNGKGDQYVEHPFPAELLPSFERGIKKLNPDSDIKVKGGRLMANVYKLIEIPNIVRSRLMNFTMELAEEFGMQIEISSFNKQREQNNKTIFYIMNKTEITNTGDANVVNTGNYATQTANITINKGDWEKLQKTLTDHGIDETDISELKAIVETEKPENGKLGSKAIDWILKVTGKALQGVGKIAVGVSSNLLAAWIKSYYGQ